MFSQNIFSSWTKTHLTWFYAIACAKWQAVQTVVHLHTCSMIGMPWSPVNFREWWLWCSYPWWPKSCICMRKGCCLLFASNYARIFSDTTSNNEAHIKLDATWMWPLEPRVLKVGFSSDLFENSTFYWCEFRWFKINKNISDSGSDFPVTSPVLWWSLSWPNSPSEVFSLGFLSFLPEQSWISQSCSSTGRWLVSMIMVRVWSTWVMFPSPVCKNTSKIPKVSSNVPKCWCVSTPGECHDNASWRRSDKSSHSWNQSVQQISPKISGQKGGTKTDHTCTKLDNLRYHVWQQEHMSPAAFDLAKHHLFARSCNSCVILRYYYPPLSLNNPLIRPYFLGGGLWGGS